MRVLFATAEAFPLAKTGGLADVSASLPAALVSMGVGIRLIIPAYPQPLSRTNSVRETVGLENVAGCRTSGLVEGRLPGGEVPVWLVDSPDLHTRAGSLYQDENGEDWPDNDLRVPVLNHAAAAIACGGVTN